MPYFVKQLDGSTFAGANCMAASDAMLVGASSGHRPSSSEVRNRTGDRSGGLNMSQVQDVDTRYYGFTPRRFQPIAWTDILALDPGRPFLLSGGYGPIVGTRYDCFRDRFRDNHAIEVDGRDATGMIGGDPGADGRYAGCPSGFQHYPFALLKAFAGSLDLSGLGTAGYRPLGLGRAYILLGPKTPTTTLPDPAVYVRKLVVTRSTLAIRNRPRLSSATTGTFKKGKVFTSSKIMRHGGAYTANGVRRTDWIGLTRNGRTDWVKRAWVRVV